MDCGIIGFELRWSDDMVMRVDVESVPSNELTK